MENKSDRIILHVDCDSAYLSWLSVYQIQQHGGPDYRKMLAVVAGDENSRHGIILAKSKLLKPYNIKTGESLMEARIKCPNLVTIPPRYDVFIKCSQKMNDILYQYSPILQRYSIDESFIDISGMVRHYNDPVEVASEIKERIKNELGFTTSVGISTNKLLAKMGSELNKPDGVSTLFPWEIKEKMFPLDIRELFGVGAATEKKLRALNINTIGELANYNDVNVLKQSLKRYGLMLYNFSRGIENSEVRKSNHLFMKGIGNSTTASFDVTTLKDARLIILSLVESVAMRLRESENTCRLVEVSYVDKSFIRYSRQRKISFATDSTKKITQIAYELFDEVWKGEPVRKFGVRLSELCTNEFTQSTLFDDKDIDKQKKIDTVIDNLRLRFGSKSVTRGVLLNSGIRGLSMGMGGGEEDYPVLSSIL